MGTIAKTSIGDWLDRIDSTRNTLIESTKSGNRIASAFAMAEARCELIESLKDESIRAKLLRITDPEIAMVELANNPTPDDRIRVCAIAILSGFTPGSDEFAVFGGGKAAGKLYVKERGFRVLFSHLGIVPEVRTTHPEYVPFGVNGKKVWRVGGSASATYQGNEYAVEFEGDKLLGIPGYDSDNVAGVSAKARRRILQALWIKVSPILTADHVDDDVETVPIAAAKAIDAPVAETTNPEPPSRAEVFQATWRGELTGLKNTAATDIARRLQEAWLVGDIPEVERIALEEVASVENTRIREKLSRFVDAIGDYIKNESLSDMANG